VISKYSIAVLPFVNMSSDPENEYFSDGIAEEILNALSRIEGLHVTARTSSFAFKNQNMDVREIGKKLDVSLLLEGSLQKAGERVRINTQLIKAADGFRVWTSKWDRELRDIFILQDEIAAVIAEKVNASLKPRSGSSGQPVRNLEALDYYLRGNYLLNTWDFSQGQNMIASFEQAIAMDPGLIQAYVGLSHTYTWLGSTGFVSPPEARAKIEECIHRMQELDPNLPDLYEIIAGKNYWMEWDIGKALENIDRALELKPSFPDALMYKSLFLAAAGKVEEALDFLFQAERLNPMSNQLNFTIGLIYNYTGESLKSIEYIDRNIEINPGWYAQYLTRIESLCRLGRYDESLELIHMLENDPGNPLSIRELKAYYHASRGEAEAALEYVTEIEKDLGGNMLDLIPSSFFLGSINILLKDEDRALDYLEMGMRYGATPFLFIRIDCAWDSLRNHPRFVQAVEKIKYPEESHPPPKYRKTRLDEKMAEEISIRMQQLMKEDRPWLNSKLNLSDLAEMLDISNHTLSQVLNEHIGKNFYDYLNSFRLEHFLSMTEEDKNRNYTMLSIAYESGFNSKTTFNSYFKRSTGKTPREYFRRPDDTI
jgi:TolB-like protein/AraC-like DNA-binding protein